MNKIIAKKNLNPTVTLMEVEAPLIAKKAQPGQFIILRVDENGERIPLTVADYDREKGTITIIFQIVGATTEKLNHLKEGEYIHDFVGPLGTPSHLDGLKKVAVVGGGVGCAIAYPVAKKLHELGAEVHSVVGFRNKDLVILEDEFKAASDKYVMMTDDGSYGEKGLVTDALKKLIEEGNLYDEVIAIGPVVMMKFVSKLTKEYGIKDGSFHESHHDRRHGNVRRLPPDSGRQRQNSPAWTARISTGTKSISTRRSTAARCISDFERHDLRRSVQSLQKGGASDNAQHVFEEKRNARAGSRRRATKTFPKSPSATPRRPAVNEAERCLNCKHKPCVGGCPVQDTISPHLSKRSRKRRFRRARIGSSSRVEFPARRVRQGVPAGNAVRGRSACAASRANPSPSAGWNVSSPTGTTRTLLPNYPSSAASRTGTKWRWSAPGPRGLTCAGDLAKTRLRRHRIRGAAHLRAACSCTVFPNSVCPKPSCRKRSTTLKALGVKVETNMVIGKVLSVDELMDEYGFEAVFIGSGAGIASLYEHSG